MDIAKFGYLILIPALIWSIVSNFRRFQTDAQPIQIALVGLLATSTMVYLVILYRHCVFERRLSFSFAREEIIYQERTVFGIRSSTFTFADIPAVRIPNVAEGFAYGDNGLIIELPNANLHYIRFESPADVKEFLNETKLKFPHLTYPS